MSLTLAMLHQSFNSSTWNPVFIDGFCHRHWEKLPCATHMDAALQGHYLLYLHHPTIRWSSQLYKNLPDISIKANAASLVFLTDCSLVIQSLQSPPPHPVGHTANPEHSLSVHDGGYPVDPCTLQHVRKRGRRNSPSLEQPNLYNKAKALVKHH